MDEFALKYIASRNSSDISKRKIYCAYHPDDLHLFNDISKDIFSVCDCTLFYYEAGKEPESNEQLDIQLSSMNLFIFIVTSNFLFKPCFASTFLFDFAIKKSIPIIPILLEGGLDEVFNSKFSTLQCLSKFQERYDATTVPYLTKLSNHLSQILSTDIDAQTLRSAFDASIFLSYRKKDRKLAQELIDLIHEDDSCRHIAIWYDEFLTPGEDFNASIKNELEQSSVFVMVVTPHIVEGDNYITLTEYPMASLLKKEVIPFEMVPTDRKMLEALCPGIPESRSPESGDQIRNVILRSLNSLGIVPTESTAERDFLIGLAYLKGICVEKNTDVGFSLILSSAQAGVAQAIRKVALMYQNGEAVKKDLSTAASWQKQFILDLKEIFRNEPTEENEASVIKAYFELADIQKQNNEPDAALATYTEAIDFCETEAKKASGCNKRYIATAYQMSGIIRIGQGNYTQAKHQCFFHALSARKEIHRQEATRYSALELAEVHALIGECNENENDIPSLKLEVLNIARLLDETDFSMSSDAEEYDLFKRIIICRNKLGHFYNVLGKWSEAFICIGETVALAEKLTKISLCTDSKRQLISAHINDGDQHVRCNVENHCRVALNAYMSALSVAVSLYSDNPDSLEAMLDYADVCERIGYAMTKLSTAEEASGYYEKALELFRESHSLAATSSVKRKLSRCCFSAANMHISCNNTVAASELLRESESIGFNAAKSSQSTAFKKEIAEVLLTMGKLYKDSWDTEEALAYYNRRHSLLKEVLTLQHTVGNLKLYIQSLKDLISVNKLSFEFEAVSELTEEMNMLLDKYKIFLS